MPDPQPTFWETVWAKLKAWGRWAAIHFAAPGVALVVVIVAVILVAMGFKELQIGGILAKLFGKKPDGAAIDIANSIPDHRVGPDGKVIPQGVPDQKGDTQAVVVPIEGTGGLFSDPNTVTITPPGQTTPTVIQLPQGVTAKDVDKVVVVQPNQFVVTVKDSSGISAQQIDDVLKKYGG